MRFSGSTVLLVAAFVLGGCGGSTPPHEVVGTRVYLLQRVGGRALPAVVDSGPAGEYRVLDGMLTLKSNDSSISQLHAIQSSPDTADSETNVTTHGEYRTMGDSIQVGFFGSCPDICAPNRVGVIGDSSLTLISELRGPDDPVYLYRLISDSSH